MQAIGIDPGPVLITPEGREKTAHWYLDNAPWWCALQTRDGVGDRLGTNT